MKNLEDFLKLLVNIAASELDEVAKSVIEKAIHRHKNAIADEATKIKVPIQGDPKQKCEALHAGQCGTCSPSGDWTPCA